MGLLQAWNWAPLLPFVTVDPAASKAHSKAAVPCWLSRSPNVKLMSLLAATGINSEVFLPCLTIQVVALMTNFE